MDLPPLPAAVERYRASLSEAQNQAVDMATRLAISQMQGGERKPSEDSDTVQDSRDRMRKKVRTIARMARMFKTLRQENETVLRLKGVCPGHKLAPGLLLAGKERLTSELELFGHAQGIDAVNEKRPELVEGVTVASSGGLQCPRDFREDDGSYSDAGSEGGKGD